MGADFVLGLLEAGTGKTMIRSWASFKAYQNGCQYVTQRVRYSGSHFGKLIQGQSGHREVALEKVRQKKYEMLPENCICKQGGNFDSLRVCVCFLEYFEHRLETSAVHLSCSKGVSASPLIHGNMASPTWRSRGRLSSEHSCPSCWGSSGSLSLMEQLSFPKMS